MSFEVIKLPPEEWLAYKELRLESLKTEPSAFGASYQEALYRPDVYWQGRLEDAAAGTGNWLLFARENDTLVGMLAAFAEGEIAEVISVYVTESLRGQGVSKRLLSALLTEIAASGSVETMRLTVNTDQLPALALYRRFGFEVVREQEERLGDGEMHTLSVMERRVEI